MQLTALWLVWLLAAGAAPPPALGAGAPPGPLAEQPRSGRALLEETTTGTIKFYCNATSECNPCLPKHMGAEACRATGHMQRMSCTSAANEQHEFTLSLQRRLPEEKQMPLHMSRSCQPRGSSGGGGAPAGERGGGGGSDAAGEGISEGLGDAADDGAGAGAGDAPAAAGANAEGAAEDGGGARLTHLRPPPVMSRTGGVNILYFEACMLLLLCGALPVVYIRKQRWVRL